MECTFTTFYIIFKCMPQRRARLAWNYWSRCLILAWFEEKNLHFCLILALWDMCMYWQFAGFLLEDILKIELVIEHIWIGFTKMKREKEFKRVFKPNIYMNSHVDLWSEGVFCSHWQINFGLLSFLNLACNWVFVF